MNLGYLSLIVTFILMGALYFLKIKKVKYSVRVFIGLALGIIVGAVFKESANIVAPIGEIYTNLIKMIVVPFVVVAIISSITSLKNPEQLKKFGVKAVFFLLLISALGGVIGIIVGNTLNVGSGMKLVSDASYTPSEIPEFSKVLVGMVPSNPVASMAEGKMIPIIIFSLFIAVAMIIEGENNPEKIKPVSAFIDSLRDIMSRVTKLVIGLTPYGVLALMTSVSSQHGLSTLLPIGKIVLAVYIACILQIVIVQGGLIALVGKVNPIKFIKKLLPAMVVAFTTQSSLATLPVTLKVLTERIKVSDKVASFVAPFGTTIGLSGCAGIYPPIAVIFIANMLNIQLGFAEYATIIFVCVISSIGMAGVAAIFALTTLGLPLDGLGMILGVGVLVDMARTTVNVTGSAAAALIVASSENEFDRESFNSEVDSDFELSESVI